MGFAKSAEQLGLFVGPVIGEALIPVVGIACKISVCGTITMMGTIMGESDFRHDGPRVARSAMKGFTVERCWVAYSITIIQVEQVWSGEKSLSGLLC